METQRIRVLVVDDSTVVRRIVAKVLGDDPRIEVVGTAVNGRIALEKAAALRPDVITLDLEMPVMGGLEALGELRRSQPGLPVIVFSAPNEAGAVGALEALQAGASDYVTKPSQLARISDAFEALQAELIPKILALHAAAQRVSASRRTPTPRGATTGGASSIGSSNPTSTSGLASQPSSSPSSTSASPSSAASIAASPSAATSPRSGASKLPGASPEIVAIGTSTGGPKALQAILSALPATFPVPIVIVQHMPATFTATLARSLHQRCKVDVREGFEGAAFGPGQVWIAPGDYHMTVERTASGGVLHVDQGPKENSCRPAVDVLFRSVAKAYGSRSLALVLTGMGSDGTEGARSLRQVGARVVIQDEQSSVVWGMPGSVAIARLADQVLAQHEMAVFLERCVAGASIRQAGVER